MMTKIKTVVLILLSVSALLYGGGQQEYLGDNTYEYNLSGFSGIDGSSSFDIEIKRADKFSIMIVADKSLKDKLIVEIRGDILYLGMKPFSGFNFKSPKAIITMPDLKSVQLSGASSIIAADFRSNNDFFCDLSGSSSLEIDITARNCTFELSGSSDAVAVIESELVSVNLSGSSDIELFGFGSDLKADLGGASSADLGEFSIKNADIEISGSSDIHVNMDGTLNIDASGASNMYYTGNVIMGDIELSGSSSIEKE
jgi:Putative auto-transporter adhesin, head GIN domain